ncbi:kinase-like domain-containing protein [Suillus americanus]|nr:kinase-like domain-containing protein [Suillus americanus]
MDSLMMQIDADTSIGFNDDIAMPTVHTEDDMEVGLPEWNAGLKDLTPDIKKSGEYPIARGGFGEIWKCIYRTNKGPVDVAVKTVQFYNPDAAHDTNAKNIKRIRRKIGNSAGLKHRNILPIYGYSLGFGLLIAIVTPWVENGSLAHYLEHNGETLSTRARFHILRDVTASLQYLHVNNIVHGDLTSPNILIDRHGAARLADFGLSISLSASASWTTTLHGNLPWMAPELFQETHDRSPVWPTKQSDVYSLGCVILQASAN